MVITSRKDIPSHYEDIQYDEHVQCSVCGRGWGKGGHEFDIAHGDPNPRKLCKDAEGDPCTAPGCRGIMIYYPPKTTRRWVPRQLIVVCCGEEMDCSGFTNTCPICHTDYDWHGNALAPRSQWGEETGESIADIMCGDPWHDPEDVQS